MQIAVLGAGNWGTTVSLVLQRKGHSIALWEFDRAQAELVASTRRNDKFLPGVVLPEGIRVTNDLSAALDSAKLCLLAVPAQTCRKVLGEIGRHSQSVIIVSLMKGIERSTLNRVSEICIQEIDEFDARNFAVISGPTIAPEVARGLPTTAVVASLSNETASLVQKEFSAREFRLYTTDDVIGVELAGALKNVIALAAGMCDGMQLGYNAKGALLTRGLAEITRLGIALGGNRQTFAGLSGIGDLITTCSSPNSRNHTVGERIGKGEAPQDVLNSMVMVAEGVWTARAALDLARENSVVMPITEMVCRILEEGKDPRQSVSELMQRTLKAED